MKNNITYYRHDVNSHTHWKFKTLRRKFGWAGEGKFWALNNIIANADNCKLDLSDINKKNEHACDIDLSLDEFNNFIEFLVNSAKLIIKKGDIIFTSMTQDVLEEVQKKRIYQKDWAKSRNKALGNEGTEVKATGTESEKLNSFKKSIENGKSNIENGKSNIENGKSNIENGKSNIENGQSKVKESKVKERLNYIGENEFSQDEKTNFIDLIIEDFSELYLKIRGDKYEISAKDKKATGQLLSRNKKFNKEKGINKNSDETRTDLKNFFEKCLNLDDWLGTNCTLPLINSKINEYKTNIKNGKYKNGISKSNSTSTRFSNSSAEARTTQQNKAKAEPDYSDSSRY